MNAFSVLIYGLDLFGYSIEFRNKEKTLDGMFYLQLTFNSKKLYRKFRQNSLKTNSI